MTIKHSCSGKAWRNLGNWGEWIPCSRSATVQRDGQWWCWQHDPERVEADKKKRRARWDAKYDRETARWEARARNAKLAALVTEELAALLERLANDAEYVSMVDDAYRCMSILDAKQARNLAARIRKALGLEGNGED